MSNKPTKAEIIEDLKKFCKESNINLTKSFEEIIKIKKKSNEAEFKVVEMNHPQLNEFVSFYYLRVNIFPVFNGLIELLLKHNFAIGRIFQKFEEYISLE